MLVASDLNTYVRDNSNVIEGILLGRQTLAAANFTFPAITIPSGYSALRIVLVGETISTAIGGFTGNQMALIATFNGDATGGNYGNAIGNTGAGPIYDNSSVPGVRLGAFSRSGSPSMRSACTALVTNAGSTNQKPVSYTYANSNSSAATGPQSSYWTGLVPITTLTVVSAEQGLNELIIGCTVSVYGLQ